MKNFLIWLVIHIGFVHADFASPFSTCRQSGFPADTAKKIYDFEIQGNVFLKDLEYANVFDIYKDTLYLIIKDRLVELDMTSGKWSINQPVTDFLRHTGKNGYFVSKVLVRNNLYYISILSDLLAVSPSEEIFSN
jgi:hypothetical protein